MVYGDLIKIHPKPYSIFLRGTLNSKPLTLNVSFHFLFHYPYITPLCSIHLRGTISPKPRGMRSGALVPAELVADARASDPIGLTFLEQYEAQSWV